MIISEVMPVSVPSESSQAAKLCWDCGQRKSHLRSSTADMTDDPERLDG